MYGHQKIRWRDDLNKEFITRTMRIVKCRYSLYIYRYAVDEWAQIQEEIWLAGLLPRLGSCHVNLHPPRGKGAFSPQKSHLSSKYNGQRGPCQTWKAVYLSCSHAQGRLSQEMGYRIGRCSELQLMIIWPPGQGLADLTTTGPSSPARNCIA